MRFRAEQHLRRPTEIRAVRENGQRVDCRPFTIWWRKRPASAAAAPTRPESVNRLEQARVCVIASTAAVGDAVHRNRAKRRLREVFRLQQGCVPPDCDLLLIARRAALDVSCADLEKSFSDACRRIGGAKSATS